MLSAVDKVRAGAGDGRREYRVEELAEAAGITTRTLRFYRERKLLQPPRKEGRIAWYGEAHLHRLGVIAELLERGHTLGGIAELIGAGESGRDVAELIGLEAAIIAPWSDETPVHLDWDELKTAFGDQLTEENTAESVAQGYISVEEDGITHVSRMADGRHHGPGRRRRAARGRAGGQPPRPGARGRDRRDLHRAGPRPAPGPARRRHPAAPGEAARLTEQILRVRPLARTVTDAQFALAMDRRVHAEYDGLLRQRREQREDGGTDDRRDGGADERRDADGRGDPGTPCAQA